MLFVIMHTSNAFSIQMVLYTVYNHKKFIHWYDYPTNDLYHVNKVFCKHLLLIYHNSKSQNFYKDFIHYISHSRCSINCPDYSAAKYANVLKHYSNMHINSLQSHCSTVSTQMKPYATILLIQQLHKTYCITCRAETYFSKRS